nr:GAF domain-containing protein [uncultured Deefgea sp.]
MPNAASGSHLSFMHDLQVLTTKIHATVRLDELLTEISPDVCRVFGCERFTIYIVSDDGRDLIAKVKTGLEGVRELRITINDRSLAGFAANHKQLLNISDVYNEGELKQYAPNLQFLHVVDHKTGFHSREMLVLPILNEADGI